LRHPVDLTLDQIQIARLHRPQRPLPQLQHPLRRRVPAPRVHEVPRLAVVLLLDLQRTRLPAVRQPHLPPPRHVMADLADRPDRVLQRQIPHHHAGLDHPQHQIGRADLQQHRRLAHVRVPDDHVQPPETLRVRMRLVPRVDDRTRPRRRRRHALPDVLRPLRHAVHRPPRRLQHLPRTGDDLPRHQIRNQHVRQPAELPVPPHQIILVAPVGVPRRIRVVLEQENVPGDALLTEPPLRIDLETLQNPLTGLVMRHQIDDAVALRRRVLRVTANVQVQPRPIAKEHVAATTPRHHPPEQIPRHLVRRQPPLTPEGAGDAVLVLQPENAPVHTMTLCGKTPTWQSLDLTICRTGPRRPRPAHDRPATAGTAATAPPRRARTRPETGRLPATAPDLHDHRRTPARRTSRPTPNPAAHG